MTIITAVIASCLALLLPASLPVARLPRRTPGLTCSEGTMVPADMDAITEQARASVRSAVLGGQRELHVHARLDAFDPRADAFDSRCGASTVPGCVMRASPRSPAFESCLCSAFTHLALTCMRALTVLDGPLVMLLPSLHTLALAEEMVGAEWPVADRERLRLGLLAHFGQPSSAQPRAAGVLVAGFDGGQDLEDPAYRNACAWLRAASTASVCFNSKCQLQRWEQSKYETAFALEPHTVTRELLRFRAAGSKSRTHYSERIWVTAGAEPVAAEAAADGRSWQAPASAAADDEDTDDEDTDDTDNSDDREQLQPSPATPVPRSEDAVATSQLGRALIYRTHPQPWQVHARMHTHACTRMHAHTCMHTHTCIQLGQALIHQLSSTDPHLPSPNPGRCCSRLGARVSTSGWQSFPRARMLAS